jgi:hypothetical protein
MKAHTYELKLYNEDRRGYQRRSRHDLRTVIVPASCQRL